MSAFNLGQGVNIKNVAPRLSEEDKKAKAEAVAKILSKGKWGPKPVVQGQYNKYPATARKEAKQIAVFDLKTSIDVVAYNTFLARTYPLDSPEILIVEQDKYFSDQHNALMHVILYYPISYLQLDTKGFQLLANPE